jgi:hypothetical protein
VDVDASLPVGLVAELLPRLRQLHVKTVQRTQHGFAVTFSHESKEKRVRFKIFYAAHPPPIKVYAGQLQALSYEGNGVHVLKFRGHPPLAGTVVRVEGLTFGSSLTLK